MATAESRVGIDTGPARRFQVGWALGTLAALAAAAVAAATIAVLVRPEPTVPIERAAPASTIYSADELAVMRLVAKGYIPAETLEAEPFITKGLVNQGLVPRPTLQSGFAPRSSLYSAKERALMQAVGQGLVPKEALETKSLTIKQLINQGLVPRQAADPYVPGRK